MEICSIRNFNSTSIDALELKEKRQYLTLKPLLYRPRAEYGRGMSRATVLLKSLTSLASDLDRRTEDLSRGLSLCEPNIMPSYRIPSKLQCNGTDSKTDTGVRVDPKGVYLLLWEQGSPGAFHWGLFIARNEKTGVLYHQALRGAHWQFVMENQDVSTDNAVVVVLKIGSVESVNDTWMQYYKDRIRETKVRKEFRCKNWVMAAIHELADSGIIGLQPNEQVIDKIEAEAIKYAKDSLVFKATSVYPSEYCVP
ncbi:hypothetical protein LOZ07_006192 [Ophidiomyces ophidiicola]|nr:hypothetical protein LOZ48_005252 [Ophidiomyces ophidiicola]KAI2288051.1 hypothetical protein LOZ07_006192 [Ophidiomyces ophidiicola]KAI2297051.1 hypothetical protein LOZ06_006013 [Ophidiomyces ophidiicola]KAI2387117.1 hypothetical protein LOY90_006125 [Ophidiomyces ophidiicola]